MLRRAVLACCLVLSACGAAETSTPDGPTYLGQHRLPPGEMFEETVIGGLSAISYDPGSRLYYIVSDDRSAENPARFYTARITLSNNGIDRVEFVSTHPWRNEGGEPFAPLDPAARPPVIPPDSEGIAFDGRRQRLYWSSEGERDGDALLDPWVRIASLDGAYVGEFTLPPSLHMSPGTGPRQNRAVEGLTLTPSGRYLWAAMEGPGLTDGPLPTGTDGALTRVTKLDAESRTATAQYAYPLARVSAGPNGDNGLTDLVALDDENFLAVERGYGTHVAARIYRVSVGDAENVLARSSLGQVRPMTKSLLVDLTTTVETLDNIEGITFGPQLPDGRRSVVLVSDDNFSPGQVTQFVAFTL
jgi:hypothetical protein